MSDTLELKSGRVLHLRPVRQAALRHLLVQFDDAKLLDRPERLLELSGPKQFEALKKAEQLFTYLAGWGVVDDPPKEDLEVLAELGFPADRKHLVRANWLRYLVLEEDEASDLIAAVMTLTRGEEEPEQEDGA